MSEVPTINTDAYYRYVQEVKALTVDLLSAEQEVELAKSVEAGLYAKHLLEIGDEKYDPELLAVVQQEGKEAFEHLALANLRLVINFAQKYFNSRNGKNMSKADYVQEGNAAMLHAIEMFDYKKGFKFSTYAALWIRWSFDVVAAKQEAVDVSVHTIEMTNRLARATERLASDPNQELTISRLAIEMNLEEDEVVELLAISLGPVSLNKTIDDKGHELGSALPSDYDLEEDAEFRILSEKLERALPRLSTKHQTAIRLRFGIGCKPMSIKNIAEELGLGRVGTTKLIAEATRMLEEHINTD